MGIEITGDSIINGPHFNKENYNYNTGIVGLEARVEPYCPFTKSQKQTFNILLNYTTVAQGGFPEEEKKSISAVPPVGDSPSVDGIYLREQYLYLSNYLKSLNGKAIPGTDNSINPIYRKWQTWTVTEHPMIPPIAEDSEDTECTANYPNWKMKKINFANTVEGDRYIAENDPNEGGEEEEEDIETRTDAAQDANIFAPTQTAVSTPIAKASSADCKHGVHWRVEKNLPLFMGQDFFIEFHRDAQVPDNSNFEIKKEWTSELGRKYQFINSNIDIAGSLNTSFSNTSPPANQGVRTYKVSVDKGENKVTGWSADEKSSKYFDLNRQAYYLIELGSDNWSLSLGAQGTQSIDKQAKYFIMITQNWKPTFLKIAEATNGKLTSYNLGTYNGIHGSELIDKREKFRITVRNHLGKIIITFDGKEDNPWIISAPDVLVVPEGKMAIWGGNISASFIFSPLTYNQSATMLLPPGVLASCSGYQFATNLGTGDVGYELNVGRVASSGSYRRISPGQPGIEITNGYIYSCDAQCLFERRARFASIDSHKSDTSTGPNYLGLVGGVSTQLKALTFSNGAADSYGLTNKTPKASIASGGGIAATDGLLKSGIGLEIDGRSDGDVLEWATKANLVAGGHYFKADPEEGEEDDEGWTLQACKTPIITSLTFTLKDVETDLWTPNGSRNRIDHRIMVFNDQWTAQDYYKVDHSGSMTLYLNHYDDDIANEDASYMFLDDIKKLQKRQFYVSIDVIYDECINQPITSTSITPPATDRYPFNTARKDAPLGKRRERIFTGIAKNGVVKQRAGVATMDLELFDYFDVLEGKTFFNSPFFDGVRDINAVYEVLRIAGFSRSTGSNSPGDSPGPAFLLANAAAIDGEYTTTSWYDYTPVVMTPYALPQSYSRLTDPYFKPEDGAPLYDILYEFAKRANKMMYFDRYGVFHYENRPFDDQIFSDGSFTVNIKPYWAWTAFPNSKYANLKHDYGNIPKQIKNGMLVENEVSIQYDISSCYNEFKIITSTPDRNILIGSNVFYEKFTGDFSDRQNQQGWLGYRRPLYQAEPIFGGELALIKTINNYSKVRNPPIVVSFEAKGLPVKALDIGILHMFKYKPGNDGGRGRAKGSEKELYPFIITNVSSTIDPRENTWQQSIEGEWIQ